MDNEYLGQFFPSRLNDYYKSMLSDKLTYESLLSTAIQTEPEKRDENGYPESVIKIEIAGISGSSLLDADREFNKFELLLEKIPELKKRGVKVTLRFLFTYLYSDFSYAQIEAERNNNRSYINEENNKNGVNLYLLSKYEFEHSETYMHQINSLNAIQDLYNRVCSKHSEFSEIFDIRFSCLPPNFCLLNINDHIFYDSYSYAKKKGERRMSHDMPLLYLPPNGKPGSVAVIKNHFWYIWRHPTTLLYKDATYGYKDHHRKIHNLFEIKSPNEVTYEYKKERVREKVRESEQKEGKDEKECTKDVTINNWQYRTQRAFKQMTRIIPTNVSDTTIPEKIFITFSIANASKIVDEIVTFLENDFPEDCILPNVLDLSAATQPLYGELMEKMQDSTMGIIFFTKDIAQEIKNNEGEILATNYYAKPNVYFEYGYLMSLIEQSFNKKEMFKRLIVFLESGTTIGTDWQDVFRIDLADNIHEIYSKILERILSCVQTITREIADNAIENFCKQSKNHLLEGEIKKIKEKLNKTINKRFPEK